MVIGKKTRSDDCNRSDEIWAMSYSLIGGIISANTALVLEVSPLRKGRVDGEYSGTEQVVENSEGQRENQTLCRKRNRGERCYIAHGGSGNFLRNLVTRSRIRRNGLQKILLCNDILPKTGFLLKHNAEDVEHEQKDYRLQPVVGTESKVKLNGLYVSAKASNQF